MKKGCKYGTHRVIEPAGVLPQPAKKISNDMEIFSNEILIDVIALNIDSASFTQIEEEAGHDVEKIKAKIKEIVAEKGKMQNPVTGSGGMLIGTVEKIEEVLRNQYNKQNKYAYGLYGLFILENNGKGAEKMCKTGIQKEDPFSFMCMEEIYKLQGKNKKIKLK